MTEKGITSIDICEEYILSFDATSARLDDYIFPHKVNAGMFIYILEGSCSIMINVSDYVLKAGDFVVVIAQSIIQIKSRSKDLKAYYILSAPDFIDDLELIQSAFPLFETIVDYPVIPIQDDEQKEILKDYYELLQKVYTKNSQPEIIKSLLKSMFRWIISIYQGVSKLQKLKGAPREDKIYRNLIGLIVENYNKERSITFYAEKLCLTPKYLSSLIKKTKDVQISEIIDKAVIMDAKTQLKTTDNTVLQISESLNFPNASFFGKYFKKHSGMTPIEYRNS